MKAKIRDGVPVPNLNFGAPRTMVVPCGGMVSRLAAYSTSITSLGCRYVWQSKVETTPGSVDGVSTPTATTCAKVCELCYSYYYKYNTNHQCTKVMTVKQGDRVSSDHFGVC